MLTFYSHPLSGNACRVLITLLEKKIPFEMCELKLDGDQSKPEFLEINPLQRVPVIVDDSFPVVGSLAIIDYLEAKYPTLLNCIAGHLPIDRVASITFVRPMKSWT